MQDQMQDKYLDIIGRLYPDKLLEILEADEQAQETQEIMEAVSMPTGFKYWLVIIFLAVINLTLISILTV
jgi:uncharacterized membrane protein